MRITFVLPSLNLTGGMRVVLQYARDLALRGHQTEVVYPLLPYRFNDRLTTPQGLHRWLGDLKRNALHAHDLPEWAASVPLRMAPWVANAFLPDGDAVVATAWPTAYSVARLTPRKGRSFYLIQHYELDSGPADAVQGSYRLPLVGLAGSCFTAQTLRDALGIEIAAVVPNGIDTDFWRAEPDHDERDAVLLYCAPGERKGAADGLAALAQVHARFPQTPLWAFGPRRPNGVPDYVRYHEAVEDEALRMLYSRSRVFLYPSRYEGFGLPPLEAMACGAAVVSTRVGAVPEYAEPGEAAWVVDVGAVGAMAEAVTHLLQSEAMRLRMARAGSARAQEYSLVHATERLEQVLMTRVRR
ncbi:MAG: glycosyltransferase family 4 protein [Anaerolineae bacterium]